MVKFDEINEDNVKDMSLEDLQAMALSGKTELMGARGVIGDLNKKIKTNSENNSGGEFNEDKFNELHSKKQKEDKFNNFLSESNLDEDQKAKAKEQFAGGYGLEDIVKLSGATSFEQNKNNSNRMNVGGGESGNRQQFDGKLTHADYKQLDKAGQEAYRVFSRPKFGGLKFERGSRE